MLFMLYIFFHEYECKVFVVPSFFPCNVNILLKLPKWEPVIAEVEQFHCPRSCHRVHTLWMHHSDSLHERTLIERAQPFHFCFCVIHRITTLLTYHGFHRNSARSLLICSKYSLASFASMSSYIIMMAVTGEINPALIFAMMSSRCALISSGVSGKE